MNRKDGYPKEKAASAIAQEMCGFIADIERRPVSPERVMQYTNRILLIMARYHAEVGK